MRCEITNLKKTVQDWNTKSGSRKISTQATWSGDQGCTPSQGEQKNKSSSFSWSVWWFQLFYIFPLFGKIPIFTNIFQMGWNHQPVIDSQ